MHKSKSNFTNYKRILAFGSPTKRISDTMQRREKTIVNTLVDPMENERREN